MQTSVLSGVDWLAVGYAFGMATLWSLLTTARARNIQRSLGKPLSPWTALIPDTLIGGLIGGFACIIVPHFYPPAGELWGLSLLAGVGGTLGPRITDWVQEKGLETLLRWAAGSSVKLLETLAAKKGGSDGNP